MKRTTSYQYPRATALTMAMASSSLAIATDSFFAGIALFFTLATLMLFVSSIHIQLSRNEENH